MPKFIELTKSLRLGRPVDRPEPVWLRYGGEKPAARGRIGPGTCGIGSIRAGQELRLVFAEPALVHWAIDDSDPPGTRSRCRGMLGLYVADLAVETLEAGQRVVFSIQDLTTGTWVESDRVIEVAVADHTSATRRVVRPPMGRSNIFRLIDEPCSWTLGGVRLRDAMTRQECRTNVTGWKRMSGTAFQ